MQLCPHCGYNFTQDIPLERGDWLLYADGAYFKGQLQEITPSEARVLYAIAKANGHPLPAEAILNRVSDSHDTNIVSVYICRLRKKLAEIPFKTVRGGYGYRWAV